LLEQQLRQVAKDQVIVTFERDNIPVAQASVQSLFQDPRSSSDEQNRSDITRHALKLDERGFITERRYLDNWGNPHRDSQDSFGQHYTYSSAGLVVRSAEIGRDGNEITLKDGVRAATFAYDANYNFVRSTLIGSNDKPIDGANGYSGYERRSDRWGND